MAASPATDPTEGPSGVRERLEAGVGLALLWVIPLAAAVAAFIIG